MVADKQHAHELIDQLPSSQVPTAIGMLKSLLDPVARAIANAPIDDEPLTPEDEKALAEARESSKAGKWIPHEEVLAEFGLTPEDVDKFQGPK
jgi:Mg-chelatase subunit ChlI